MSNSELLFTFDKLALRIRCCQDCLRRIFDAMDNDNPDKVDRLYMRSQVQHARDYLETADRILNDLADKSHLEVLEEMRRQAEKTDELLRTSRFATGGPTSSEPTQAIGSNKLAVLLLDVIFEEDVDEQVPIVKQNLSD